MIMKKRLRSYVWEKKFVEIFSDQSDTFLHVLLCDII